MSKTDERTDEQSRRTGEPMDRRTVMQKYVNVPKEEEEEEKKQEEVLQICLRGELPSPFLSFSTV